MLLDRPLKLCRGPGNGVDQAGLMTATNMLSGCGDAGDAAVCTCEVLRDFIVRTNDAMHWRTRRRLYGPLPWSLVGTRTTDSEVHRRRAEILVLSVSKMRELAIKDLRDGASLKAAHANKFSSFYCLNLSKKSKPEERFGLYRCSVIEAARAASLYGAAANSGVPIWEACRDALVEAIAVGSKTPVELKQTPEKLVAVLNG